MIPVWLSIHYHQGLVPHDAGSTDSHLKTHRLQGSGLGRVPGAYRSVARACRPRSLVNAHIVITLSNPERAQGREVGGRGTTHVLEVSEDNTQDVTTTSAH